jgi:group II intron reverse transcriptase/maturase
MFHKVRKDRRLGNLKTPEKIRELQRKLYIKAKQEPEFRFYLLYDKIYREDILEHAYRRCRANDGSPGVDGISFKDIESASRKEWLGNLSEELKAQTYKPDAIKRVMIPKAGGGSRPLGIPTIRDRVAQMAAVIVLEPIFEADFPDEQHGYRPKRDAKGAVGQVLSLLRSGHREVVDADLKSYFDTIPHQELMKSVARRVVDKKVLRLVKLWQEAPVEEEGGDGRKRRTTPNKDARRGISQGGVTSPLLSNIYMRRFIVWFKSLGFEEMFGARIVNYADDFVICCKRGAKELFELVRKMMTKLKLTVNEEKTRVCRLPEEAFNFLGYTFERLYSPRKGGHAYIGVRPSKKSINKMKESIHEKTLAHTSGKTVEETVRQLNMMLDGWANYFSEGTVAQTYKSMDHHTRKRLRQWLCRKYKVGTGKYVRFSDERLYEEYRLVRLSDRRRDSASAKT